MSSRRQAYCMVKQTLCWCPIYSTSLLQTLTQHRPTHALKTILFARRNLGYIMCNFSIIFDKNLASPITSLIFQALASCISAIFAESAQGHLDIPFLGVTIPVDFRKNPEKSHYRKTRVARSLYYEKNFYLYKKITLIFRKNSLMTLAYLLAGKRI